jgi:hypothetical protein
MCRWICEGMQDRIYYTYITCLKIILHYFKNEPQMHTSADTTTSHITYIVLTPMPFRITPNRARKNHIPRFNVYKPR